MQDKDKGDEGRSKVHFLPPQTSQPHLILECPLAVSSIQVINVPERSLGQSCSQSQRVRAGVVIRTTKSRAYGSHSPLVQTGHEGHYWAAAAPD